MHKKRILTVDDEPSFTRLVKLCLESTGDYEVRAQNDATSALEVAEQFKPDLILLDMVMPKMHGRDIAARIHSSPLLQGTPVVLLTATVTRDRVAGTPKIDGCKVLAKPIALRELVSAIEETLS
ncbi:MAG TPA: response regulator [Chthoniobacteraceae bacterium]|nr:response regulator [Chthoniobacteraceae bacterium]